MEPLEYDPYSYEIDRDPYPVYRRMRDEAPLYHNERLGFYALTRFDDCLDALVDWQTYSSAEGTVLELMGPAMAETMIIFMDPPRQTRVRNLVSKGFTPARIAALEPEIRSIARRHLARLAGEPRFDVLRRFTAKLPMDVISALLGIPEADRDDVREWSNGVLHRDPGTPTPPPESLVALQELSAYFHEALEERRRRPREDVLTLLLQAESEEAEGREQLSPSEVQSFAILLATAGNETVTKLLAQTLYWLWRHPDQRQLLLDDPSRIPGCVEEMLRFDPPSQYQGRTTTREVSLHGFRMPKGARVAVINAAAGRDERRFPEPDRFDVCREIDLHLGLGHGRHVCLGASLARLESRVALEELLAHFPSYEIPSDGVERMHSSNVRGFAGLVLEVPS